MEYIILSHISTGNYNRLTTKLTCCVVYQLDVLTPYSHLSSLVLAADDHAIFIWSIYMASLDGGRASQSRLPGPSLKPNPV